MASHPQEGSIDMLAVVKDLGSNFPEIIANDITIDQYAASKVKEKIIKDEENHFVIGDLGEVVRRVDEFRRLLPQIKPYYAVKANDDLTLLQILGSLGVNFDCASQSEIEKVLNCHIKPHRIIYANPCKYVSHIRFAKSKDVSCTTFDCEDELHKIKEHFPKAKLVLRLLVDDSGSIFQLGMKFGVPSHEVHRLIDLTKKLELNLIGVSFHVGSMCENPQLYASAIKYSIEILKLMTVKGIKVQILDIGGGFPGSKHDKITMEEMADVITRALDKYAPASMNLQIIAEPGRYFCTSAYECITKVCTVKRHREPELINGEHHVDETYSYYLNDGVYGMFDIVRTTCGFQRQPSVLKLRDSFGQRLYKSTLWGPTCDSIDLILTDCMLPQLKSGDWLRIEAMGSYSITLQTGFNGFSHAEIMYFIREKDLMLAKRLLGVNSSQNAARQPTTTVYNSPGRSIFRSSYSQ